MANGVEIAGLAADVFGAILLAAALVFERARDYARAATPRWNYSAPADVGRAKESAQALAGLALIVVGFVGQAVAAAGVHTDPASPLQYIVTGVLIGAAYAAVPVLRRCREWTIIRTRIDDKVHGNSAEANAMVWRTYAGALHDRGRGPAETQTIRDWAERRYGRRFVAALPESERPPAALPFFEQQPDD